MQTTPDSHSSRGNPEPSPALIMLTLQSYQRSAALKAGIDLALFTAIANGATTVPVIAAECEASEKGVRVLCDYLTIAGFLTKQDSTYGLTQDSAIFLSRTSPAYLGDIAHFLTNPEMHTPYHDLAAVVRKGGTTLPQDGTVTDANPVWIDFARSMAPMMRMPSQLLAGLVGGDAAQPLKVLDIAAGHGLFGIAVAQKYPSAHVTALDWPAVLEVAVENATIAGVADRITLLTGSAFDVEYGEGYDLILLTNFLHHFAPEKNIELLRKVHAALAGGGRAITLEFVPNPDRVSPPMTAGFALTMLGSTPHGDAYTFAEFEAMFQSAGFSSSEFHPLPGPEQIIISHK
jgi:SAM-dependent methyltransferase